MPSPTFTLVQMYPTKDFFLWHFDLYRIKKPEDLLELGLEEAFYGGVSLVEWPERLGYYTPKKFLSCFFEGEGSARTVTLGAASEDWEKRLNDF